MFFVSQAKRLHIIYKLYYMESNASSSEGFNCNICYHAANDLVVTTCSHLFCWPCLYTWLNFDRQPCSCLVCRSHVTQDENIIQVYQSGEDTSSHADDTNNNGATISPHPTPPRVLHENPRRTLHSSNLRGSTGEWEDRYIEILGELRIFEEHQMNTLRVERDGLRSELEHLRRTIDKMWHHESHITNERDYLLNTTHELQRAIFTKNQELKNLLTENKKLQSALLTQNREVAKREQ